MNPSLKKCCGPLALTHPGAQPHKLPYYSTGCAPLALTHHSPRCTTPYPPSPILSLTSRRASGPSCSARSAITLRISEATLALARAATEVLPRTVPGRAHVLPASGSPKAGPIYIPTSVEERQGTPGPGLTTWTRDPPLVEGSGPATPAVLRAWSFQEAGQPLQPSSPGAWDLSLHGPGLARVVSY